MKIKNRLKNSLIAGVLEFYNIHPNKIHNLSNFIKKELENIKSMDLPPDGFSLTRKLYKSFKIDPTKYRPSSEALWRRLKKKGNFPSVNPFVDLLNLLSLKFQVSCGLYDIEKINGDIEITIGNENDFYEGIRKDKINLNGKIVLKDNLGAFGNPSSDSLRTSVSLESKNILIILFFYSELPENEVKQIMDYFIEKYTYFFEIEEITKRII
jgi:DNA/RNA-binding domain of Phe-tRNA-synthetase-like protein